MDTGHDEQIILRNSPILKQEQHSRSPKGKVQYRAPNATHTRPDYRGSSRQEVSDASMSWTEWSDEGCQIHLSGKPGSGWYLQFSRRTIKAIVAHDHEWQQEMKSNPGDVWGPPERQQRKAGRAHKDITA